MGPGWTLSALFGHLPLGKDRKPPARPAAEKNEHPARAGDARLAPEGRSKRRFPPEKDQKIRQASTVKKMGSDRYKRPREENDAP